MNVETHKKPVNQALYHLTMDIKKATLQSEEEEYCEEMYGGCSDRSIEFTMLECQAKDSQQTKKISIERDIIEYLKYLGLKMKTDPKAKQDRYYQKLKKNRIKRACTMIEEDKLNNNKTMTPPSHKKEQVSIQMNSILIRRSPHQSGGSSPLITLPTMEKNIGKSRFSQLQPESSPKSDRYIQNDISNIYKF